MKDQSKTKQILIQELASLKQRIEELEQSESVRKRVEETLRESEEKYRTLVENASDIVFRTDENGNFIFVNSAVSRITGYTAEELIGKRYTIIMRPDMGDASIKFYGRQFVKRLQNTYAEYPVITKEGHELWFGQNAQLIVKDGHVSGFQVVARDITDRKQVEEALKESSGRYKELSTLLESLFDAIPDVLGVQDKQHGIIRYNQAGYNFLGLTQQEVEGKKCFQLINRTKPCDICATAEVYKTKEPARLEKYIEDMGIWLDCRSYPVFDEKGNITRIIEHLRDITELKNAENALRKSDELLRLITDNMSDMVRVADLQGINLYTSPSHFKGLGYRPEEQVGKSAFDIVHPDDLEKVIKAFSEGLAANRPVSLEYRVRHADGHYIWLETVGDLLRNAQGNVTAVVMSSRDVSDRRQAEETLRESETLQRTLLANLPTGVIIIDPVTRMIENVNNTAATMFGVQAEHIVGHRCHSFLCPASDGACPVCDLGKEVDNAEREMVCADGSRRPVLKSVKRIQIRGQEKLLECFLDITDRKRAEDALRESEEKYRSIFETTLEGIYQTNPQGCYLRVNPAFALMLGYASPEDLIGSITDIGTQVYVNPDRRSEFKQHLSEHDRVENFEALLYRKDGTTMWGLYNAVTVRNENGDILYFTGGMIDVTERKRVEEEKRILEERLQHADKMESIGTLAGGIAHDFNNLLMGIQGYASLMLLDLDSSNPHYERLKRIEEQVQSGANLTRQLLGFARGGRYEVKPADMNDIIEKTSSMFGRTKKEINIHRKYGKDLWGIEVDQGQMEQVFMNLYVNAWQAMPGGGEIYIETGNVLLGDDPAMSHTIEPGRYVKILITDTGTGMDAKTRERIFDPFFTTKAMGRGTGLGLATVYGIIKGHRGVIHVDSEPGHGTTFTIYLPASEKEVVKEKPASGTIARGAETILLVDDERMVLAVTRELLESLGYRVYAAGSGQEAIAVYMEKGKEISLVILDMIMPGISGGETFDRLKKINPDIRVLLSSGYSINGEAQTILDRGCGGFLQKPFQLENLSRKVREVLD